MHRGKSLFISAYVTFTMLIAAYGAWLAYQFGVGPEALTVLFAGLPPTLFYIWLFARPPARTSRIVHPVSIPVAIGGIAALALVTQALFPGTSVLPAAIAQALSSPPAPHLWLAPTAAVTGAAGWALYLVWYSSFGHRSSRALTMGQRLPRFKLQRSDGRSVSSAQLTKAPTVWMFYRGNWCPLCMAQVREVAAAYRELEKLGVRVALVSPQPATHTARLAARFDVPMDFYVDRGGLAVRELDLLAHSGTPAGLQVFGYDSDTVMPTVMITAAGGKIVYLDQTDNYRVRPEPEELLRAVRRLSLSEAA